MSAARSTISDLSLSNLSAARIAFYTECRCSLKSLVPGTDGFPRRHSRSSSTAAIIAAMPGADSLQKPIRTLLVANRGEIAVRVIRAAHELRMRAIAIYGDG